MRKILLTLLILGLPGIACSQQPSDQTAQEQQEEQQPQAAQEQAAPQEQEEALQLAEGSLSRVDAEKQFIWIKTQDGKELQFSYNQATQIEGSDQTVEGLAKEMSGSDLKIHYRTEEGGTNIAVRIEVQGQKT